MLADGTKLRVRPVRPEDAEIERAFVASLSEQTRYFRFFYRLHQLTPAMLARFTQVDYDRELALLALAPRPVQSGGRNDRGHFALHRQSRRRKRGIRRRRRRRLARPRHRPDADGADHRVREEARIQAAGRRSCFARNQGMLKFSEQLGFEIRDDPDEPEQVTAVLTLA